jgi:hypothetical protein
MRFLEVDGQVQQEKFESVSILSWWPNSGSMADLGNFNMRQNID